MMVVVGRRGLAASVLVGLSALSLQCARAGHLLATANTIQVSSTRRLAFGRLLNDLAPGASETVSFTDAGNDLVGGTDVIRVGGTVQAAGFTISASQEDMAGQSVTLSVAALETGAGTATLPWRWVKADYNGTKTARATQSTGTRLVVTLTDVSIPTIGRSLDVFGGIEVRGDMGGDYKGVVTVTANHQ